MNENDEIKLPDRHEKNPFNVPDSYFDTLPDHIIKRVNTGKRIKKYSLLINIKPLVTLAAGFIVLIGLSLAILNFITNIYPGTKNNNSNNNNTLYAENHTEIINEEEMTDDVLNEIIAYLINEQNISNYITENSE